MDLKELINKKGTPSSVVIHGITIQLKRDHRLLYCKTSFCAALWSETSFCAALWSETSFGAAQRSETSFCAVWWSETSIFVALWSETRQVLIAAEYQQQQQQYLFNTILK